MEAKGQGPPTYRVNGNISHRIGPIHPETEQPARFLQVYFLGDSSMQPRDDYFTDLNPELIRELRGLQRAHNVLLRNLMRVYDEIQTNDDNDNIRDVVLSIVSPSANLDRRTHNVPSRVEVAAFVPDYNYDNDSISYPLYFVHGESTFEEKLLVILVDRDPGPAVINIS